jgi:hypothetical protein
MKEFRGKPDKRLSFQCRVDRGTGAHILIVRNPAHTPELHQLLARVMMEWQREKGRRNPPSQITIGRFTRHGFSPSRRWLPALELEAIADRIAYDLMRFYGPGGPYHEVPDES